jgi:hypothetical protein
MREILTHFAIIYFMLHDHCANFSVFCKLRQKKNRCNLLKDIMHCGGVMRKIKIDVEMKTALL